MSNTSSIDEILNVLQELNNVTGFDIFIPSLNKNISFKQLSTVQLKELLKTSINEIPIYNTQFILLINSFIKDNCLDQNIDTTNFTVLDKLLFVFKTRIESISPEYEFLLTDDEKTKYNTQQNSVIVDLNLNYNYFINQTIKHQSREFKDKNYSVEISLPTIKIENDFEEAFHNNIDIEIKTKNDLQNLLSSAFVNEVAKYIQKIQIDQKIINLNELDFNTRIKFVESLPATITNEVLKFIDYYKGVTNLLTTVNITLDNQKQISKRIPIDASFFNI
jgi:hypothetical protein